MRHTIASALVLSLVLPACARMQPRSGVAATGEPLTLETRTSTWKETKSEKVGESDHYSSDGEYVGTTEQYRDKTVTKSSFHWRPKQGNTYISDEDFYRIAGDEAKAEKARRYRRNGKLMTVGGTLLFVGGTAAALAGAFGDFSDGQSYGLYMGGGLGAAGGGLLGAYGFKRLTTDGHPYRYGEAQDVIDQHEAGAPQAKVRPAGRSVLVRVIGGRF